MNPTSPYTIQQILTIHHWNDRLFSFRTTRDPGLRFLNGQFVLLGLINEGRPLLRAYSFVSANHDDFLEFLSIKVPGGPLTTRLQKLSPGDEILIGRKPTGTLLLRDLKPGKHLYLLATGTGLAPFLSIIQDPDCYLRFEQIILFHGVRTICDLAYRDFITRELPAHDYYSGLIDDKLVYFPSVTREAFEHSCRITELIENGRLCSDIGMPPLDPAHDRVMICGNPGMTKDCAAQLDRMGFSVSPHIGAQGDYLIERAFVEK